MNVLVLNSGSSSQKSCLYEIGEAIPDIPPNCAWEGKVEWAGDAAELSVRNSRGVSHKERISTPSRGEAVERLLQTLWSGQTQSVSDPSAIDVAGHRVVHGGPLHFEPSFVTPEIKTAIEGVSAFAPLHNRAELDGMGIVEKLLGKIPQVAVFDTGFHHHMPLSAVTYPGPYDWFEHGIRRYGFHGINHQYCAQRAAQSLGRRPASLRLVTCHLGNGCSLAAILDGRSIDTTMGFTPLEGLMMGTRSGSVDPGILIYLMRQKHLSGQQLDDLLNKKSGLLGISGVSSDMREILSAVKTGHQRAKLALDIYIHRLRSGLGAMIGVLGGVDAFVFTGGVGENSPKVRAEVCRNFEFLGVRLDAAKNEQAPVDADISTPNASVRVLVIHAQEDWMIARECSRLMKESPIQSRSTAGEES